jgi:hypothetical protein
MVSTVAAYGSRARSPSLRDAVGSIMRLGLSDRSADAAVLRGVVGQAYLLSSLDLFYLPIPPGPALSARVSSQLRFSGRANSKPPSHIHQVDEGGGLHFFHDPTSMCLDRDLTDIQLEADLLVH